MPRAGLDPELVVRHASALVDADGVLALTLARVASELGVATPSLYKHIGGLDDLLVRVAASAMAALATQLGVAARGRSGRAALKGIAHAYRRFAREHPGTYPLTQRAVSSAEWEAAASDAVASVVAALSGYGVAEDDTDRIRFVRAALHGFVDLERSGGFAHPASVDESFAFLIDALDATLRALGTKASIPP
jgi:AcrR family transcriptional regulator